MNVIIFILLITFISAIIRRYIIRQKRYELVKAEQIINLSKLAEIDLSDLKSLVESLIIISKALRDKSFQVNAAALKSLSHIHQEISKLDEPNAEALFQLLIENEFLEREMVAKVIINLNSRKSLEWILKLLLHSYNEELFYVARESLIRHGEVCTEPVMEVLETSPRRISVILEHMDIPNTHPAMIVKKAYWQKKTKERQKAEEERNAKEVFPGPKINREQCETNSIVECLSFGCEKQPLSIRERGGYEFSRKDEISQTQIQTGSQLSFKIFPSNPIHIILGILRIFIGLSFIILGFTIRMLSIIPPVLFLIGLVVYPNVVKAIYVLIVPILSSLFFSIGSVSSYFGERFFVPSAKELINSDKHNPILYFRPFTADQILDFAWDRRNMSILYEKTEEMILAELLKGIGPCIALGKIGEKFPPLGMVRLCLEDNEWQEKVVELMIKAQLVIIRIGNRRGYWLWELSKAVELVSPNRLLILVPFETADVCLLDENPSYEYEAFRSVAEAFFPQGLPVFYGKRINERRTITGIIYFESDWTPHTISLNALNKTNFEEALRIALLKAFLNDSTKGQITQNRL